ncbi:MAG TPA: TetR/AcrR family transcriptional regulator [Solirubrobacteraceae bacterium]|nr:TetR/AcrR family transcriptional regulator [Solirubrobacteraceae bacterium]
MELSAATPRSPRGRRAARVSGDDRERAILATAERLLGERPLHEISVDDLARGAGISRPTFYFYFASKEAVLLALMDRLVEEARSGIELALLSEDPPRVVRDGIASVHRTFREHRVVTIAAADARASSPALRELWARVMEVFVEETAAAIESERARGAAPAGIPARDLATALNLMNERAFHATLAGEPPAIEDGAVDDTLVEVWLRAIYGTTEPPSAGGPAS